MQSPSIKVSSIQPDYAGGVASYKGCLVNMLHWDTGAVKRGGGGGGGGQGERRNQVKISHVIMNSED